MVEQDPTAKANASGRPYKPWLRDLVERKRRCHYSPDIETARQGFRGWYERGYLPHFDAPNVTQFVTFMLNDAFPVTRRREWEPILLEPEESLRRRKLEAWLDRGHGPCWLRLPGVAGRVEAILRSQDAKEYQLQAWVIMPNHVHLVVHVWQKPLADLLNQWKGRSAYEANRFLGRQGRFWQRESFETLIRDSDHRNRTIRYTEHNPLKAALVKDPKQWPWCSARLRDEYNRLPCEL